MSTTNDDRFSIIKFQFFRDLNCRQRLTILTELGVLPRDLREYPSMGIERMALDLIRHKGKLQELEQLLYTIK